MRRLLAVLSAGGLATSIVAYVKSLSGATTDDLNPWVAVLVVGALALQIPIPFLEHSWSEDRRLFWKRLWQGMPRWAFVCVNLFWLIAIAHLLWFFVRSEVAIPIVKEDQYVLSSHGRIRRVLTEQEYLTLRAAELRVFAAFMIACYVTPVLYWWSPESIAAMPRPLSGHVERVRPHDRRPSRNTFHFTVEQQRRNIHRRGRGRRATNNLSH